MVDGAGEPESRVEVPLATFICVGSPCKDIGVGDPTILPECQFRFLLHCDVP